MASRVRIRSALRRLRCNALLGGVLRATTLYLLSSGSLPQFIRYGISYPSLGVSLSYELSSCLTVLYIYDFAVSEFVVNRLLQPRLGLLPAPNVVFLWRLEVKPYIGHTLATLRAIYDSPVLINVLAAS